MRDKFAGGVVELVMLLIAVVPERLPAGDPWERCARQISLAPVVQLPDGSYRNLILDMSVMRALAVAGDQIALPVLPFLDARRLAYRTEDAILMSSGFAAAQESPQALRAALLELPRVRGRQGADYRYCITGKPVVDEFWGVRMAWFGATVQRYRRSREPQLKTRRRGD